MNEWIKICFSLCSYSCQQCYTILCDQYKFLTNTHFPAKDLIKMDEVDPWIHLVRQDQDTSLGSPTSYCLATCYFDSIFLTNRINCWFRTMNHNLKKECVRIKCKIYVVCDSCVCITQIHKKLTCKNCKLHNFSYS